MKIRIKTPALLGAKRFGLDLRIDKIEKRPSQTDPSKDTLILFLKRSKKTGILALNSKELEILSDYLKPSKPLESEPVFEKPLISKKTSKTRASTKKDSKN